MDSKKIDLNFFKISELHLEICNKNGDTPTPELWHKFLKECGMRHISLSRIEVYNKKKYFLAKIKYGF